MTGPGPFIHSGLLSIDEVFSPLQLAIDCEIARYLTRMANGLESAEDQVELSIRAMTSCVVKGHHLTDETTLRDHGRIYWTPDLFDYSLLRTSKVNTDIAERAREICRKGVQEQGYRLEHEKKKEEAYKDMQRGL